MNKLKLIGRYGSNRDGRLDSAVGFTHSRLINGHSPGRPAGHSQGRSRGLDSKGPTPHRERVIPPFCHCHNGRANKRAPEGLSVTRPPRIRSMNAARSDGNACKARLNASKTHWHTGLSAERMMISRALSLRRLIRTPTWRAMLRNPSTALSRTIAASNGHAYASGVNITYMASALAAVGSTSGREQR